jgi:hypothetical protein
MKIVLFYESILTTKYHGTYTPLKVGKAIFSRDVGKWHLLFEIV